MNNSWYVCAPATAEGTIYWELFMEENVHKFYAFTNIFLYIVPYCTVCMTIVKNVFSLKSSLKNF